MRSSSRFLSHLNFLHRIKILVGLFWSYIPLCYIVYGSFKVDSMAFVIGCVGRYIWDHDFHLRLHFCLKYTRRNLPSKDLSCSRRFLSHLNFLHQVKPLQGFLWSYIPLCYTVYGSFKLTKQLLWLDVLEDIFDTMTFIQDFTSVLYILE